MQNKHNNIVHVLCVYFAHVVDITCYTNTCKGLWLQHLTCNIDFQKKDVFRPCLPDMGGFHLHGRVLHWQNDYNHFVICCVPFYWNLTHFTEIFFLVIVRHLHEKQNTSNTNTYWNLYFSAQSKIDMKTAKLFMHQQSQMTILCIC